MGYDNWAGRKNPHLIVFQSDSVQVDALAVDNISQLSLLLLLPIPFSVILGAVLGPFGPGTSARV